MEDLNYWIGPPHEGDDKFTTKRVQFKEDGQCDEKYHICEHRWPELVGMVNFRNFVKETAVRFWWDNSNNGLPNQIAFSRGDRGFVAINNENTPLKTSIKSSMPRGIYCDLVSGVKKDKLCTGRFIKVDGHGLVDVNINVGPDEPAPMIAIHLGTRVE